MVDDEKFFAWIDGELAPEEAARVEAEVASNPELQSRADEHRRLKSRLGAAFDTLAVAPVPDRLLNAVREDNGRVISLADERERRAVRRSSLPIWKQAAAMAATLVLGVAMGNLIVPQSGTSPIAPEAGRLVASADLEEALYAQLASAPSDRGPRIGLTYRDQSGSVCRTFEDRSASGLACREGGDWRIRALFQGAEGQATDYRMASGADPRLLEIVDSTIAGEPFDAAQEKDALERGWK
jgi:hypothetical protein